MAEFSYQPSVIEPKWQAEWAERHTFRTPSDAEELRSKPKYYVLDMFPYPSGAGLHVGPRADVVALNAAAALLVAERVASVREGLELARARLASGAGLELLERFAGESARSSLASKEGAR